MLVLASLISWFGAELFKGIIFTIGLVILIPFLLLVLIYVVASLDEHPPFRKLLSKKAVVDKSPSFDLGKGKIASEEQVQPAKQVKRIPVEDRYLFQEWSSEIRDDLPETHRYRSMRLKQTPVGFDFFDTEEILQKLIPSDWSSELRWALWPPVGPRPRASWGKPTWRKNHEEAAVYIIKFDVKATNGDTHTIFKAGITARPVTGTGGRYSKKFGPEVLFEKRLRPAQAWACEQKLLHVMHRSPFDYTFEAEAKHWGDLEDAESSLPEGKGNATYHGKDLKAWCDKCDEIRAARDRKREQDGEVLDRDSIVKTKSENLGETEWRTWPYSVESLIAAAKQIVDLTIANDAWLEAMLSK